MEMQLNNLIEKIKQDGVEQAKRTADDIIQQAERSRKSIIAEAKQQAESIIKEAENNADNLKDNADKAIGQAVRDAVLSLKQEVKKIFEDILTKDIQATLTEDFLEKLVIKFIDAWGKDKDAGLEIVLNPQDKDGLGNLLISRLKHRLHKGITVKVNPNINKGLYIGLEGSNVYYDFTDQAILEILKQYLRPFILKIIEQKTE